MTRLVDLDDVGGLERAVAELERVRRVRALDPGLRASVLRLVDAAVADGRLEKADADAIRGQLDEAAPAVVLDAHVDQLLGGRALGAFPRRERENPVDLDAWLRADPRRLAGVVAEVRRFTNDLPKIVEAVLGLADRVGIDAELADRIVCAALREKAATRVG